MTEINSDLESIMSAEDRIIARHNLLSISPDDAKYSKASKKLSSYLSADAEWRACAFVQRTLLETRIEYGQAKKENLDEVDEALTKLSPLNMSLLEDNITKHDQLAVIEEIGRFVSEETKALLHPGTTSYDILDTARSYLLKKAWKELIRPEVTKSIDKLCEISEKSMDILQVGRTHLQNTSPVPMGATFAGYAARLADRVEKCDSYFDNLKGKVSGIVGTGASVEVVIGKGKALQFEIDVLKKLGLKPDYTATQIVQKEALTDVGHGITTLALVLADFANDIRILYSSAINEVTSRDSAERLGGSSADAGKNNPINYENIGGKAVIIESSMRILYDMIHSDLQRDLRNSVEGRYQPQAMMTQTYEMFSRVNRSLKQLSINADRVEENLRPVRDSPTEAMVAILRGVGYIHPEYGVGHDFVKEMGKRLQTENAKRKIRNEKNLTLMDVTLKDDHFKRAYNALGEDNQSILFGKLELYIGPSVEKANANIEYSRSIVNRI